MVDRVDDDLACAQRDTACWQNSSSGCLCFLAAVVRVDGVAGVGWLHVDGHDHALRADRLPTSPLISAGAPAPPRSPTPSKPVATMREACAAL